VTDERILVVNPGSTSTKVALFEGCAARFTEDALHGAAELARFPRVLDQYDLRARAVEEALAAHGVALASLACIVGRGGPLKPLGGGVYLADDELLRELREGKVAEHVSSLGGLIARHLADPLGIPAYIADPVSVDEFDPLARFSGLPELPRVSLHHALNGKAVAWAWAEAQGRRYEEVSVIVAHLGGGITIGAHRRGRVVDVNNANDGGPFSPERAGTLPLTGLVKIVAGAGVPYGELKSRFVGRAGLVAHLGTNDAREVEARIAAGDARAARVYEAMAYGIAKEIGAMAAVLHGRVDAILLTGGLAHSERLTAWIEERVSFIAPVRRYPGGREMEALALHGLRALRGEVTPLRYGEVEVSTDPFA
jgi:butyrate kinase